MKKYILITIFSLLSWASITAQINAGISGVFDKNPVGVGQTATLEIDFATSIFDATAAGDVYIVVSFPASGDYTNDYTTQPTGPAASYFTWTPNASQKAWVGLSNQEIPAAINGGGGKIYFDVVGVNEYQTAFTLLNVTLTGDVFNIDDNAIPSLTVPVELSSFYVKASDCGAVDIQWTTESEINSDKFLIERKIDNGNYELISSTKASGESNSKIDYSYTDQFELYGKHFIYYRLKVFDKDGKFDYSDEVVTNYQCKEKLSFEIYPNPAVSEVSLDFSSGFENDLILKVYDNTGKVVMLLNNVELDNDNTHVLDINRLPEGIYRMNIQSGSEVFNKNLIILKK